MNDFNALFEKLLRQAEARDKKRTPRQRTLDTGDTDAGRAMANGPQGRAHELDNSNPNHRGSWNVREYRQNPGATKGRGKSGGIRK